MRENSSNTLAAGVLIPKPIWLAATHVVKTCALEAAKTFSTFWDMCGAVDLTTEPRISIVTVRLLIICWKTVPALEVKGGGGSSP